MKTTSHKKPASLAVTTVKPADLATVPAPTKPELVAAMVELKRREAEEFNKAQGLAEFLLAKAFTAKRTSIKPNITWSLWDGNVSISVRYDISDKSQELIQAIKAYNEADKKIVFDEKECAREIREAILILSKPENVTKLKALMDHIGI